MALLRGRLGKQYTVIRKRAPPAVPVTQIQNPKLDGIPREHKLRVAIPYLRDMEYELTHRATYITT